MIDLTVVAGIFDWIKAPFGYLLRGSYALTHSYAIAIIVFALVIRVILLPFGIKQQKGMIAQAKLRPKEMKIRNKYKGRNDKVTQEKLNTEIMELYREENYSPFSGCLPLLIQLPVILILFWVVTAPVTYVVPNIYNSDIRLLNTDGEHNVVEEYISKNAFNFSDPILIKSDGTVINEKTGAEEDLSDFGGKKTISKYREEAIKNAVKGGWFTADTNNSTYDEIDFIQSYKAVSENDPEAAKALESAIPGVTELKDFNCSLFGLDLLERPKFFNWLLLIPVLSGILSFLSTKISKKFNGVPAAQNGTDAGASLKVMDMIMPLFSVYIAYIVPGAVGFYWMMSNVIQVGQTILLSKLYPIPSAEQIEAEYHSMEKDNRKKKKSKSYLNDEPIETTAKELPEISKGTLKDDK